METLKEKIHLKNNVNTYERAADENNYLNVHRYFAGEARIPTPLCHFHDSYEVVFVKRGKCCVHVKTESRTVSEGEIVFIDSFMPHFYYDSEDADVYIAVIGKSLITGLSSDEVFETFLPKTECCKKICDFIDVIWNDFKANGSLKAGIANVIAGYLKSYYKTIARTYERASETFVEVLKFIDKEFYKDITLEGLSEKFGYAPNYFSELFNKFTDMHLREYLNRRRISEVVKLKLERPEESLSKIAGECGFKSEKTFYRAYKDYKR